MYFTTTRKLPVQIDIGTVGANAYKASDVWKLGIHFFKLECGCCTSIARWCMFRNRKKNYTFYIQLVFQNRRKHCNEICGGEKNAHNSTTS